MNKSDKLLNCWEFKKCGREPGGSNVETLGVCRAAEEVRTDGINRGRNGGRACWAISGTLCGGQVQGTFASKLSNCLICDFFKLVVQEEGHDLVKTREIINAIKDE